jgi:hypothetical protein
VTEDGQIPKAFLNELTHLINRHNIENVADTPDFLLAGMICRMIEAMGPSIKQTLDWHGCRSVCHPGPRDAVEPPCTGEFNPTPPPPTKAGSIARCESGLPVRSLSYQPSDLALSDET